MYDVIQRVGIRILLRAVRLGFPCYILGSCPAGRKLEARAPQVWIWDASEMLHLLAFLTGGSDDEVGPDSRVRFLVVRA